MTDTAEKIPVIAIDGPGGSGKGTISRLLADRLGWQLLDSGALYRVLALAALNHDIATDDSHGLEQLASNLDVRFVTAANPMDEPAVLLEGENVTQAIRTEKAGNAASQVAALTLVRDALLQRQRAFLERPGLVADGRDMGTVVFTEAPLKIYLTASAEERANRRYKQLKEAGESVSLAALLDEIKTRDDRDMNRSVAPLKPAEDAIMLDSTAMTIMQVVDFVVEKAKLRQLA